MLEDRLSEIKNHLVEVEAETGTLTEEEVDESIQAIRHAITEHYKIEEIPDPEAMIEEHFVKPILEAREKNKQQIKIPNNN